MSTNDFHGGGAAGGLARLRAVVARLRGPDGCPWDREQTLVSLKPCLLEETYELLETMEDGAPEAHAEELGDVLLQVVLQARIREEAGQFTLDDVAQRLVAKLIRRHPHVFGAAPAAGSDEALRNWEQAKRAEKQPAASALEGVPRALPALSRSQRLQTKAARAGFDWPAARGARAKIAEELRELDAAVAGGARAAVRHEAGDLLFSIVNLCRFLKLDAEDALQAAADRFARRFREVERRVRARGLKPSDCSLEALDAHWEAVKAVEPSRSR